MSSLKLRILAAIALVTLLVPLSPLVGAEDAAADLPVSRQAGGEIAVPLSHDNLLSPDGETINVAACNYQDPTGQGRIRPSLAVGVNNFGTFIDPFSAPGATGIQVPAGVEHLAHGWYGEGWLINDGSNTWSYYLHGPNVGGFQRVDDVLLSSSSHTRYVATLLLGKGDMTLLVDMQFDVDHATCDVMLRTRIENQGGGTVPVYYKRVVDLDVTGLFTNCWYNVPSGVGAFVPTVPGNCASAPRASCTTTAVGYQPYDIEFDAWDDRTIVGPGGSWVPTPVPANADWNAGFHYRRVMEPNDVWTTFLKYECNAY